MMCLLSCVRALHASTGGACMCVCVWDVGKAPSSNWHLLGTHNRLVFLPFPNQMVQKSPTSPFPRLMQIPRWEKAGQNFPAGGPFLGFSAPPGTFEANLAEGFLYGLKSTEEPLPQNRAGPVEDALPLPQQQRTRWREISLSLKCHQCFLFFCHLLCTPGKRETERQGTGGEARNPSGSCCR